MILSSTDQPPPTPPDDLYTALEREPGSAYLLSPELRLTYVNEGWRRFARENGAPDLAADVSSLGPVTDVIPERLRVFYRAGFERVLSTREPWYHVYECSSPEMYRKLSMRVALTPARDAFVVVHSTVVETPHDPPSARVTSLGDYQNEHGLIVQCANCRRVRREPADNTWDWLPQVVEHPPDNVSHGLCNTCDSLYYSLSVL